MTNCFLNDFILYNTGVTGQYMHYEDFIITQKSEEEETLWIN